MTPFHLWLAAAGLLGTILFLALYIGWAKQAMVERRMFVSESLRVIMR